MGLSPAQAETILYDWEFWARPKQLPPPGDWFVWLIRSGRGFGKTRTGAETVRRWAQNAESQTILIAGRTADDVRAYMVEHPRSGILVTSPPWFRPIYEPSKRRLVWPNGVIGLIRYGDEPDGFRSFEGGRGWLDELFHWKKGKAAYDTLMFGMRERGAGGIRMLVTSTPKPTELCRSLIKDQDTIDVKGSTDENEANLDAKWLAKMRRDHNGTRLGRQELDGEVLDDVPGAQWSWDQIARDRVDTSPVLEYKAVSIDPAASVSPKADETGIIAGGRAADGHGYCTHDESGRYKPHEWASRAVALFLRTRSNVVIVEDNNGGDMVESTLRSVKADLPIRRVHAKDGKRVRAEPISTKSEAGRIHHVGCFPELEHQLCTVDLDEPDPDGHDDRLDAYVHLFTHLLPDGASNRSRFAAMA